MNSSDLSTYSLEELTQALRVIKNYKISLRQIGGRAKLLDPKNPESSNLVIEYAPGFDMDTVTSFARAAVSKYFPEASFDNRTMFRENTHITGWIRIFYADDMMDVSFEKFKNILTLA